jgi:hypothetical protein
MTNRNDKCSCGSDKKYKICCLEKDRNDAEDKKQQLLRIMKSNCSNCNKYRKYMITCVHCDLQTCRNCSEKHLLQINKNNINNHCIKCGGQWNIMELYKSGLYTETFITQYTDLVLNTLEEIEEINEFGKEEINEFGKEELYLDKFQIIKMPPDGSCFYHCILYSCKDIPEFQQLFKNYSVIYDLQNRQTNKTNISILRFAISENVSLEDYEQYKMLQDVGIYHSKCENIEDFKKLILIPTEYINDVTLNVFLRIVKNKLGLYIYNNNMLVSPYEYRNKKYNILLRLEGEHYDVLSLNKKIVIEKDNIDIFVI